MTRLVIFLILFIVSVAQISNDYCRCTNGGQCPTTNFQSQCVCPPLHIGKHCETQGTELTETGQYLPIGLNFSHFIFLPEEPNLYKFTFEACMLTNPYDYQTLIFMTSDQDNGSPQYQPSIFSSAKIKIREGNCLTFTSPFIEIKKHLPPPFWRIIIGVKAIPTAFKNYFYRTVPGKKQRPLPQQILDQHKATKIHHQNMFFRVSYQTYKESVTQGIIRIFVKVVFGAGIVLALCLFSKIALFSYGIDTKQMFLYIRRMVRSFWRKVCPLRGSEEKNYRNYLRYRSSLKEQEKIRLQGDDCPICLQQFQMADMVQQTLCRHIYHQNCLQEWSLKNEICPICRQQLRKNPYNWYKNYGF